MTNSAQPPSQAESATGHQTKCNTCGALTRLDTGLCVSCLLHDALNRGGEVSRAAYETVLDEVHAPEKPWFLGNYEILEQIGCGGMGVIYRARQRHSRRIVAVKRVLSYRADSHGALQRFRREAQAVASLDHPNILPIYEVTESEDGLPFFSMKFAEKGSLHENVASLRDQPRTCVQLMAKVARAVEYAHSRGVLHRDIKPGNILLNKQGEPLVSDFGLAKLLDGNNDLTRSLTTFGTAGFIAPEQAGHAAADFTPAADVYSLGAVLFNLLAGRPPFLGSNPVFVIRQASEIPAPKLRSLAPSLDRDLETICARSLERDPRARYPSAGDLAADLERWLDGRPIVARPVSPPARIWRWTQRNPRLVGAATAGLVLGAAAVWLFRTEFSRAPQFNPPDRSIAVLPFTDSGDPKDQDGLCDGISEEILQTLGHVEGLHVAGRSLSFSLKGKDTKEIGEKLNVANVLEGSLQRRGNHVRITAELIDARNGFRLWTQGYDRDLDSAFALQDEIARSIIEGLKIKFAVRSSAHEPSGSGAENHVQGLFTDSADATGSTSTGVGMPVQNRVNPITVPNYTSAKGLESSRLDTLASAALSPTAAMSSVNDRASGPDLRTKETTHASTAARAQTGLIAGVPDRSPESGVRTNKITAEVTAAHPETRVINAVRDHPVEAGGRTNKVTPDVTGVRAESGLGSRMRDSASEAALHNSTARAVASIKGFVKDAKGEPIKGADVRIASRDGKQVFSTATTDPKGRYASQGLQPGVYRVTLLMNGVVKASIMNAQANANQPTQLNFDFKPASQAGKAPKSGKHMVWMPNRTGSHIGGTWVEVDDEGNEHSGSNIQTYTARRW